jgi:hypothetical protein
MEVVMGMQGLRRLGRAVVDVPVVGVLCLAVRNYVLPSSTPNRHLRLFLASGSL